MATVTKFPAKQAGVNPNVLSRLINGIDPVKPQDERIISVGQVIGLSPSECFEKEPGQEGEVVK